MSVKQSDIKIYGSNNMQESDAGLQGGAIDTTRKVVFDDLSAADTLDMVSSAASTTGLVVYGRNAAGQLISESGNLNGTTIVNLSSTFERILKVVKNDTTGTDVAVYRNTASRDNTAQAGADESGVYAASITLDAGADGSDDTYNGQVIYLNGGTGANQIRQIIDYTGSSKIAYVNRNWETTPSSDTEFIVSEGVVLDWKPIEIMEVRRPFYSVSADVPGGATRNFYEKIFVRQVNSPQALLSASVVESSDGTEGVGADVAFDLEVAQTGANTSTDRTTEPDASGMLGAPDWNDTSKNVPNSDIQPSGEIGVWMRLNLPAGTAATNTTWAIQVSGSTT
jgi:hypothetical protein